MAIPPTLWDSFRHAVAPRLAALARRDRMAALLEAFSLHAHLVLLDQPGPAGVAKAAREFLAEQGFDLSALDELPMGLFVDRRRVGEQLEQMGFSAAEIAASQLAADPRLEGRLVGPIRGPDGRIESFWARHPGDRRPRYLFKGKWKESVGLFGLDAALRPAAAGREHLVIVEQLLDALLFQSRGLGNVAAIGGPAHALTPQRWERLATLGVRRITVAVAVDQQEWDRVLSTLKATFPTRSGPEVFLLPPGILPRGGVARWVRDRGVDALRSLLEAAAVHVDRCQAAETLKRCQAVAEDRLSAPALHVVAEPSAEPGDANPVAGPGTAAACPSMEGTCRVHHCAHTECFCFD